MSMRNILTLAICSAMLFPISTHGMEKESSKIGRTTGIIPTIVVVGETGVGKSMLCNFLQSYGFRENYKVEHTRKRGTDVIKEDNSIVYEKYDFQAKKGSGKPLFRLIDTPGVNDGDIEKECLHMLYFVAFLQKNPMVGGVCFVEPFKGRDGINVKGKLDYFKNLFSTVLEQDRFAVVLTNANSSDYVQPNNKFAETFKSGVESTVRMLGKSTQSFVFCTYFDCQIPLTSKASSEEQANKLKLQTIQKAESGDYEDNLACRSIQNRKQLISYLASLIEPINMSIIKFPLMPKLEDMRKVLFEKLESFKVGESSTTNLVVDTILNAISNLTEQVKKINNNLIEINILTSDIDNLSGEERLFVQTQSGNSSINLLCKIIPNYDRKARTIRFDQQVDGKHKPRVKCIHWNCEPDIYKKDGIYVIVVEPDFITYRPSSLDEVVSKCSSPIDDETKEWLEERKDPFGKMSWYCTGWISCDGKSYNEKEITKKSDRITALSSENEVLKKKKEEILKNIDRSAAAVDCHLKKFFILDSISKMLSKEKYDLDDLVTVCRILLYKNDDLEALIKLEPRYQDEADKTRGNFEEVHDKLRDLSCFKNIEISNYYNDIDDPYLRLLDIDTKKEVSKDIEKIKDADENKLKEISLDISKKKI